MKPYIETLLEEFEQWAFWGKDQEVALTGKQAANVREKLKDTLIKFAGEVSSYVDAKVQEKHKKCLIEQFENGYFWAMKDMQTVLAKLIGEKK